MMNRTAIHAAVAAVSLGLIPLASAQFDDAPYNPVQPTFMNPQRGGTMKPIDPRPYTGSLVPSYDSIRAREYQAWQRERGESRDVPLRKGDIPAYSAAPVAPPAEARSMFAWQHCSRSCSSGNSRTSWRSPGSIVANTNVRGCRC